MPGQNVQLSKPLYPLYLEGRLSFVNLRVSLEGLSGFPEKENRRVAE